jgi:hypothetical protein
MQRPKRVIVAVSAKLPFHSALGHPLTLSEKADAYFVPHSQKPAKPDYSSFFGQALQREPGFY